MANRISIIFFVTVAALTGGPALGQTSAPPPLPVPTGETVLATPDVELQVGPRFWYLMETHSISTPQNNLNLGSVQSASFPMAGGTLSARFARLPNTTFILSALYGKSNFAATGV